MKLAKHTKWHLFRHTECRNSLTPSSGLYQWTTLGNNEWGYRRLFRIPDLSRSSKERTAARTVCRHVSGHFYSQFCHIHSQKNTFWYIYCRTFTKYQSLLDNLMIFGIKLKCITLTPYSVLLAIATNIATKCYTTHDWFCAPGSHRFTVYMKCIGKCKTFMLQCYLSWK